MKKTVLLFLVSLSLACSNPEHESWKKERAASLKKEDGWLNLAGLFWLNDGQNTFGSDSSNTIVFPAGKADALVGSFVLRNDSVFMSSKTAIAASLPLSPDSLIFPTETSIQLRHKNLVWFIIKRGDRFAVRLRDLDHAAVSAFEGIPTFPFSEKWIVVADFIPNMPDTKIPILDVIGMTSFQKSPGKLAFSIDGTSVQLETIDSGDELFLIFGDQTNRSETYGSGRYLYVKKPDQSGKVTIDFNKAINPPCAFTEFATCPLPPESNKLNLRIEAGEKRPAGH